MELRETLGLDVRVPSSGFVPSSKATETTSTAYSSSSGTHPRPSFPPISNLLCLRRRETKLDKRKELTSLTCSSLSPGLPQLLYLDPTNSLHPAFPSGPALCTLLTTSCSQFATGKLVNKISSSSWPGVDEGKGIRWRRREGFLARRRERKVWRVVRAGRMEGGERRRKGRVRRRR